MAENVVHSAFKYQLHYLNMMLFKKMSTKTTVSMVSNIIFLKNFYNEAVSIGKVCNYDSKDHWGDPHLIVSSGMASFPLTTSILISRAYLPMAQW